MAPAQTVPQQVFCGNKVECVWTRGSPSPGLSAVFVSSHRRRFQFAPLGSAEVAGGCRCWVGVGAKVGGVRELAERASGGAPTHRSRSSLPLSSSRSWLVRAETRSASTGLGHGGGVGKEGGARCSRFQASWGLGRPCSVGPSLGAKMPPPLGAGVGVVAEGEARVPGRSTHWEMPNPRPACAPRRGVTVHPVCPDAHPCPHEGRAGGRVTHSACGCRGLRRRCCPGSPGPQRCLIC